MKNLLILMICALFLVACTTTVQQSSAVDAPAQAVVELKNFKFIPDQVTIKRGGSVTFVNKDSATHTATAADFDSGDLKQDASFTQTFEKTGNTNVKCKYHPSMSLKVIAK